MFPYSVTEGYNSKAIKNIYTGNIVNYFESLLFLISLYLLIIELMMVNMFSLMNA